MNSMKRKTKNILACSLAALIAVTAVIPAFAASNSTGSSAADVEDGQLTGVDPNYTPEKNSEYKEANEGTHAADVYVSQGSTYTVTLPKTIVLDGTAAVSNKGAYKISVDGDISGDEIINVTPKSNNKHINSSHAGDTTTENGTTTCANITDESIQFYLGQKYKDDIIATVNQEKQSFTTADLQSKNIETPTNITTGEVSTNDISAGSWNGNFYFNIKRMTQTEYDELNDLKAIPNGYKMLYKYDLSATENDDVAAYYCVPNKNTEEITVSKQDENKINNYSLQTTSNTLNQSNNKIIEANGIKYTLSDEDTLIIGGQGKMKENIANDFIDYHGLFEKVYEKYPITYVTFDGPGGSYIAHHGIIENNDMIYLSYQFVNIVYPSFIRGTPYPGDKAGYESEIINGKNVTIKEIRDYIDTIKDNYIITLPKTVKIQNGVTNISKNAFLNLESLTNITIPNSVKDIGESAFNCCSNLTNISIGNGLEDIGSYAFYGCRKLKSVIMPDSVTNISQWAFGLCESLTNIKISNSVKNISNFTFFGCSSLVDIKMPNNLTSIGTEAFESCRSLTSITIPNSVTSIDACAFINCTNLAKITISNNIKNISSMTFSNCSSLTKIIIPNSVKSIDRYAFSECSNLKNIFIPGSVTSIGDHAFENIATNSKIYCETQEVADLLIDGEQYDLTNTTVMVDVTKF